MNTLRLNPRHLTPRVVALGDSRVQTYEKRSKGLNTAGSAVGSAAGVVAAIPAVPWTQIAGAILGLVAASLKLGAALRKRGTLALQGDEAAVRKFAKRAARWSSEKRARVAKKILKKLEKTKGKIAKRKRGKKMRLHVRSSKATLKLKVLYALEAGARAAPNKAVLADDPESVPVQVEQDPMSNVDQADDLDDNLWWYAGGAALIVGGAALIRSRGAA